MMMLAALAFTCLISASLAQINPGQSYVPCGVPTVNPITKRIVGGKVAAPGSWPWLVMLVDDLGFISGSGVIIHPNVILTSAQHFEGTSYNLYDLDLHLWKVYAGEYNISTDDPYEKFYHIRRVQLHPGYNATSLKDDVALVILINPITWNDHTRPACLPDASHTYKSGQTCYLPGWGSTSSTGNEEVLNQLQYPILPDSICQQHWTDFLPDTEVCAGYENQMKDFCGDDIGSPLMCQDQVLQTWYIQGLASSGGDCTKGNEPGIFEDVSKYTSWIKKTMEQAGYPYAYDN